LTSLVATTLNKYGKKLYGQCWDGIPFFNWMRSHGRVKGVEGGLNIIDDIEISQNSSVGWRDPKSPIGLVEQDPFRQVAWAWKTIDGGVPLFWDDERKNRGDARIIDFGENLIRNLRDTMQEKIGIALFADGTTDPDSLDGLDSICDNDNVYPAADDKQQVTGINRATAGNEYWQANCLETTEPWSLNAGTDGGWLHAYMLACKGKNNDQPDIILCDQKTWETYDATLLQSQRFESPKLAEAGFRSLMYKNCAVVWDENCPANTTYILNTRHISLRPDTLCADRFVVKQRHPMEDVLADRILMVWTGNMTCQVPNRQSVLRNKTT